MQSARSKMIAPKFTQHIHPGKVPFKETGRNSSMIKDGKRRQLEAILDSERDKEQKGRLGCILIDRLVRKFGAKHSGLITFFVEEFLTSHNDISKDEISELEREVGSTLQLSNSRTASSAQQPEGSRGGSERGMAPEEFSAPVPISVPNSRQMERVVFAEKELSRPPSGAEWMLINSYQLLQGEEKEKMEREAARAKKTNFRKSLDEHQAVAHTLKATKDGSEQDYAGRIQVDIQTYNIEERDKFAKIRATNRCESDLRRDQIEIKKANALTERAERLESDRAITRMNLTKMKEDQERAASIRREKLEAQAAIQVENHENERLKEIAKEKEAVQDQLLMVAYAARMDREAIERENAFQMRMEQMGKHGQKYATEGAGKAIRDANVREELLLLKEQQRKETADIEKEHTKEADRRQRTLMQLKENERQIVKKKAEAVEQHDADLVFKDFAKAEAEAHRAGEEEKMRKYRAKQEAYRSTLDMQVSEVKKIKVVKDGMSYNEKEINMPTIRDVTEDPKMLSRVLHRMRVGDGKARARAKAPF
ncbi:hypothetical protein B484DRAFT_401837 [Ochromonadaceae sp. CCMP2298]|nr:hypothetical protein B484DRAFT_401837 [Ochromonadaceae sp. CCMP2298]